MLACFRTLEILLFSCIIAGCNNGVDKAAQTTNCPAGNLLQALPSDVTMVIIGDTSTHDPHYMTNNSGEIVKIPVDCGFLIQQQIPIEPYAVIQDASIIQTLLKSFGQISNSAEQGLTFSGTLSEQFFLNSEDQLVFSSLIICDDNTVVISTNGSIANIDGIYCYEPPTNIVADTVIKNPEYVRHIYSLMQKHAPEQIQKRKDFYQKIGINFEELLFRPPVHDSFK